MAARSAYAIRIFAFDAATSRSLSSAERLTAAAESFTLGAATAAEAGRASKAVRASADKRRLMLERTVFIDTSRAS